MNKSQKMIENINVVAELVDVLDKNGNITGISKSILKVHQDDSWHQASHVWVFNSEGEIILQKRAEKGMYFPGLWDIPAAGQTSKGENPDETAIRELYEEIGIKADSKKLKKIEVRKVSMNVPEKNYYNNEFDHIYLYKFNGNISELELQKREVDHIKFMPIDKFKLEIQDPELYKKYVPHGEYYFDIIRAIRKELNSKI